MTRFERRHPHRRMTRKPGWFAWVYFYLGEYLLRLGRALHAAADHPTFPLVVIGATLALLLLLSLLNL